MGLTHYTLQDLDMGQAVGAMAQRTEKAGMIIEDEKLADQEYREEL